jgi:hypothetical protein
MNPIKLREPTRDEVVISFTVEQDDIPVRGNAMVSGDDEEDKKVEDEILERLDRGDVWAWAFVEVIVRDPVTGLKGHAGLGACSYGPNGEEDFKKDGYDQLVDEALEDLHKNMVVYVTTARQIEKKYKIS